MDLFLRIYGNLAEVLFSVYRKTLQQKPLTQCIVCMIAPAYTIMSIIENGTDEENWIASLSVSSVSLTASIFQNQNF